LAEPGFVSTPSGPVFLPVANVDSVQTETYSTSLVARYGIIDDLQASLTVPFNFTENSRPVIGQAGQVTESDTSVGDIGVSFNYAVMPETYYKPNVILSAGTKIPVEGGPAAATLGVSALKRFDPASLFGNISYTHNFVDESGPLADLTNESVLNASFGLSFAMNERLSTSASFQGNFAFGSEFDRPVEGLADTTLPLKLEGRENYVLRWAITALLTENLYIEPSVTFDIGGTGDNFAFGLSLPYTF
jgi:hypothetical protein